MRASALLKQTGDHICWICRMPIDMGLPVNDKWSWTLDHYYPLALYPCIGLLRTNHREAHRTCNSAKADTAPHSMHTHSSTTRDW